MDRPREEDAATSTSTRTETAMTTPAGRGLGQWISVVAVVFIGLVMILGYRDPALPGVLRGEPVRTLLVTLLAVVAFALAAMSVFVTGTVRHRTAWQLLPAAVVVAVVVTIVTVAPASTSSGNALAFWAAMVVLLLVAAGASQLLRRSAPAGEGRDAGIPLRAVAILAALVLIAAAGYGVTALEQRSTERASYPRIGMANAQDGPNATVTATADSDGLPVGGVLEMQVYGVPRTGWDARHLCATKGTHPYAPPCEDASCFYVRSPDGGPLCRPLGYMLAQPDQRGVAHAELAVMIPLPLIERVEVVSRMCRPVPAPAPPTGHDTTCAADDGVAGDPPKQAFAGTTFVDP